VSVCVRACGMGTIYDLFSCPCFFRCFVTYSIPPGIFILLVLVFVVVVRSASVRLGSYHTPPFFHVSRFPRRNYILLLLLLFSSLLFSFVLARLVYLCMCRCRCRCMRRRLVRFSFFSSAAGCDEGPRWDDC
jgi:hypothetical protein